MTGTWKRREFVRAVAGGTAGLALGPLAGPAARAAGGSRAVGGSEPGGLPRRTIGCRSLGGAFRFDPAGLLLRPGDSVVWLNMGDFHTTTAFHPKYADLIPGDVPLRIPAGAEPWHSGMLGLTSTQFEQTVTIPGVYDYFCQPHYSFGMVGRLVVAAGGDGAPEARPADELNEASRREMPPVSVICGDAGRAFEWASRINGVLLLAANDEPAGPAAGAVGAGARADRVLARALSAAGEAGGFETALRAFVDGVRAGEDYERLVALADAAKTPLDRLARNSAAKADVSHG
ncbi:MAG: plastocyanin/azurin family copper-binding protein [Gemmatimonadota bacterium]